MCPRSLDLSTEFMCLGPALPSSHTPMTGNPTGLLCVCQLKSRTSPLNGFPDGADQCSISWLAQTLRRIRLSSVQSSATTVVE